MHKLLLRQLKRTLGKIDTPPDAQIWQNFLATVNEAYVQADADRSLLEHSLEVTSQELLEHNQQLRRDLADRQKMAEALLQSEERYRRLVELSPDGILIHREGQILFINPAGIKLLGGESASQIMEKPLLEYVHPDYREVVVARIRTMEAVQASAPLNEEKLMRLDGTVFDGEVTAIPFMIDETPAFQVIFRDITERKKAEEQRLAMERNLLQTQRLESLGVLAGGIAHDFNNLLVAILGNAELALLELEPDAPARFSIEQIQLASRQAAELTQQMLAYSGKGRFVVQPLDLNLLIKELLTLLRAALPKNVTITTVLGEGLPLIEGDATQIRQVVMNLVVNAAEALGSQPGIVRVTTLVRAVEQVYFAGCHLAPALPADEYVVLEVIDSGRGMDAATVAKIFEPFFTTKFVGHGLGLAAVLGIVRGHQGAIKIESVLGEGTTFSILFPACARLEELSIATPPSQTTPSGERKDKGSWLVVDDEEKVCEIARRMLEREGFTVMTASDGWAGIELFRQHQHTIKGILLDLTMPRLGGQEAFAELRRIREDVPIVLMSGYSNEKVMEHLSTKGGTCFLAKPFTSTSLYQAVSQLLKEA